MIILTPFVSDSFYRYIITKIQIKNVQTSICLCDEKILQLSQLHIQSISSVIFFKYYDQKFLNIFFCQVLSIPAASNHQSPISVLVPSVPQGYTKNYINCISLI